MATQKQAEFLYYNIQLPHEIGKTLSVEEASQAITAYKKVMEQPVEKRHQLKGRLRNKILGKGNCVLCGKPLKPVNSPNSCSC